jgi:hypothetical protein
MSEKVTPIPMTDPALDKLVKQEVNQFWKMCPPDQDPVLTILRGHLLSEHYLERLIASALPRGDKIIEGAMLSFAQKLNVVESLDLLPDKLVQSLKGLNRVRNSCAHEMDRDITIPDVERVGRPFGPQFTSLRRKYYPDVTKLLHEVIACIAQELSGRVYLSEADAAARHETPRSPSPNTR